MTAQIAAMDETAAQLTDEKIAFLQAQEELSGQLAALREELTAAETALTAAEKEKDGLQTQLAAANEAAVSLKGELTQEQGKTAKLAQEIERLQTDANAIRAELKASQDEADSLEKQILALTQEQNDAKAAAEQEQQKLQAQVAELDGKLRSAESALDGAKQDNDALNERVGTLDAELTAAQARLEEQNRENQALSSQAAELKENLSAAQDELNAAKERGDTLRQLLRNVLCLLLTEDGEAENDAVPFTQRLQDLVTLLLSWNVGLESQTGSAEEDSPVALSVNGKEMTRATLDRIVDASLTLRETLLDLYPQWQGQEILSLDREKATEQAVEDITLNWIIMQRASALGLDELTEADRRGLTAGAEALQSAYGLPAEDFYPGLTTLLLTNRLGDWAARDAAVSQDELNAAINKKAREQQELYERDPDAFTRSLEEEGAGLFCAPTSLRRVKHIFIATDVSRYKQLQEKSKGVKLTLENEEITLKTIGKSETPEQIARRQEKIEELQNELASLSEELKTLKKTVRNQQKLVQRATEDIYARMQTGDGDFDALVAKYSDDQEMPADGYVLCAQSNHLDPRLVKTAMSLTREGTVSKVQVLEDGIHILYFSQDLSQPWAVIQQSRAQLKTQMESEKRSQALSAALDQWIAEADVRVYLTEGV